MEEREFLALADAELQRLEASLARLQDGGEVDFDYEIKPGGVIEIECADGSKIIVNRHAAAQEIWVAARSGGYHFRYADGRWISTRDGEGLQNILSRSFSAQAALEVRLAW